MPGGGRGLTAEAKAPEPQEQADREQLLPASPAVIKTTPFDELIVELNNGRGIDEAAHNHFSWGPAEGEEVR